MEGMDSKSFDLLVKLLVIGDSGVGKTSLLLRFDEDKFSPNYISTIGIDYRLKMLNMENKRVKLQIWDTGGQERFKNITTAYYRGATGIILVYDVTDANSFQDIRYWMESLQQHAPAEVDRIIIGNKCDLANKRVISKQRGEELAQEFGVPFYETSAKSSSGVEDAFMQLTKTCFDRLNSATAPSTQNTKGTIQLIDHKDPPSSSDKPCAC